MAAAEILWRPSPNCGARRDGLTPRLIVLHFTAMQSAEAALARLCDRTAQVSAHYLSTGKGDIVQMVSEDQRAWHAGVGEWAGQADINSRSIGIELDNRGNHPFSEPQMAALEWLMRGIMNRWEIAPEGVIGHSDMAPGRKDDPGPRFDWARLARLGLARHGNGGTTPTRVDAASFRLAARRAGYTAPVEDDTLLEAVRLRFRPQGRGPLVPADLAALPCGSPEAIDAP